MPSIGATAPEQHGSTDEISITEEIAENYKYSKDVLGVLARYDNDIGWVYDENYFKDLVQESSRVEELPAADLEIPGRDYSFDENGRPSQHRKTPLYSLAYGNLHLTSKDLND